MDEKTGFALESDGWVISSVDDFLEEVEFKKVCSVCSEEKTLSNFHRDKRTKSGYRAICTSCRRKRQKSLREMNIENERMGIVIKEKKLCSVCGLEKHHTEFTKDRGKVTGLESFCRDCSSLRKKRNPKKGKAHQAVRSAVVKGILLPAKKRGCVDCGGTADEYHHESYEQDQWLNVVPLCRSCHKGRHSDLRM